jgi:hypothetical protein
MVVGCCARDRPSSWILLVLLARAGNSWSYSVRVQNIVINRTLIMGHRNVVQIEPPAQKMLSRPPFLTRQHSTSECLVARSEKRTRYSESSPSYVYHQISIRQSSLVSLTRLR